MTDQNKKYLEDIVGQETEAITTDCDGILAFPQDVVGKSQGLFHITVAVCIQARSVLGGVGHPIILSPYHPLYPLHHRTTLC